MTTIRHFIENYVTYRGQNGRTPGAGSGALGPVYTELLRRCSATAAYGAPP